MKLKALQAAIAVATLAGAQGAYALVPGTVPDLEIYMSGATAQDKGIGDLFSDLCVPGTLDTYRDNANIAKPGAAHSAYFCTLDSTNSKVVAMGLTLTNPKVLFHKRSAGGSAQGVQPLLGATPTAIPHMSVGANCTKTAPETFYRCTTSGLTDTITVASDAGVSDVNPELFRGPNIPAGFSAVNTADVSTYLDVTPAAALVFGTPVTLELYKTLQTAQIAAGTVPNTCAIGDYTEACMPSLTKEQVASIMSGRVQNWDQFKVNVGGVIQPLTFYQTSVPTNKLVGICRRVDGSGTQAVTNQVFLNNPCGSGALAPAAAPGNPAQGPVVVANSGSGDVENCLVDFNDGTVNLAGTGPKRFAIGVQSLEFNSGKDAAGAAVALKNYRFIKIDGVAPTLANTASGKYIDWAEITYQWRKTAQGGPTGDKLAILKGIAAQTANPAILSNATTGTNLGSNHPFGQSGLMSTNLTTYSPTIPFTATNPVMPYTHASGASLDNCRAPAMNAVAGKNNLEM